MKYILAIITIPIFLLCSCQLDSVVVQPPRILYANIFDSLDKVSNSEEIKNSSIENLRIIKGFRGFKLGLSLDLFERDSFTVESKYFFRIEKEQISPKIFQIIANNGDYNLILFFFDRELVRILASFGHNNVDYDNSYGKYPSIDDFNQILGKPSSQNISKKKLSKYKIKVPAPPLPGNEDIMWEQEIIPEFNERITKRNIWQLDSIKFFYENTNTTFYYRTQGFMDKQRPINWSIGDNLLFTLERKNLQKKILEGTDQFNKNKQSLLDSINKINEFQRTKTKL